LNVPDNPSGAGNNIRHSAADLNGADFVLTSSETLRSDFEERNGTEASFNHSHMFPFLGHYPLLQVFWEVVIFDEAHKLCNANTGNTQAAKSIRSLFRLLLTGMPVQNEYSAKHSLIDVMDVLSLPDTKAFKHV
jgi:SNF2 family DNA or RNA helicase